MSQFTQQWYEEQLARKAVNTMPAKQHDGLESELHDKVANYCKSKRWAAFHSRMDKRSTNQIGTPDFIIAADGGRTFYVELKRKGGKPTPQQLGTKIWLEHLGHKADIIYSFEDFLAMVEDR